jgi:hypothetical protein
VRFINGLPEKQDIVVMTMDGRMIWSRVTDDNAVDFSPAFGSPSGVGGVHTVLFGSVGGTRGTEIGIWKQVIDTSDFLTGPGLLIGSPTLVVNTGFPPGPPGSFPVFVTDTGTPTTYAIYSPFFGANGAPRLFAVNTAYDRVAFVQSVSGRIHIAVVSLNGGAVTDLGEGWNPYWSHDGSERILFTLGNALWVMNPDGSERRKIAPLANMHATPPNSDVLTTINF